MSSPQHHSLAPQLALITVTAVWGSTFFLIKDLLDSVSPLDFLGVRFTIAALFMAAVFARRLRSASREVWKHGLLLGCVYASAQVAQTWGLAFTDASVSGFITGMYVVLTPLVLWMLFRTRILQTTWIAVFLATVGLAILSLRGVALGLGETITFLGAALYALHIVLLGRWSSGTDAVTLTSIQMISIAGISLAGALPGGITLPQTTGAWLSTLYMVFAAGILALLLQTWAQARMGATRAAIIMTTEPVFAAGFAVAFGGEALTWRLLLGGALILAAMQLAELAPRRKPPRIHGGRPATPHGATPTGALTSQSTIQPSELHSQLD
ncbi:MAG: DMT family transporter [Bowdeniella nasicola]|nr:DMT family transporter [Bowdeniella nasicola]